LVSYHKTLNLGQRTKPSGLSPTLLYIIIGNLVLQNVVYFVQDRFIFKPEKLPQDFPASAEFSAQCISIEGTEFSRIAGFLSPQSVLRRMKVGTTRLHFFSLLKN